MTFRLLCERYSCFGGRENEGLVRARCGIMLCFGSSGWRGRKQFLRMSRGDELDIYVVG